ncbi:TIM barrel protein [Christensenellaceae bacterium OttesenSCG-928-K19]|nr:TIM barrel protein [Christensenellaceae bacterium OttesenSCG-928-K19]
MRYSLCIEPLFENINFYDRIKLAADAGLDAVEFWDPSDKDCAKIGTLAQQNNMEVAICCANDPWNNRINGTPKTVLDNIKKTIPMLRDMGCQSMIVLAGDIDGKNDTQKNILIENLKRMAEIAEKENITFCVEALNSIYDHKGYYLDSSYTGFEILKCVDSPKIKLLYDIYHMQIMEGNVIENISGNIEYIGHFHSAGVPGRNEHFNGETDYTNVQKCIESTEYDGFFGLEYWATYDNAKSLADVMDYLKKR